MDVNEEIAHRRNQLARQRQAEQARQALLRSSADAADRELRVIAQKFIHWARASGISAQPISVAERTPTEYNRYTVQGWVLSSVEENDSGGWVQHYINFVLFTDGRFHKIRSQRPELFEEHFSSDQVLNHIVDYILRSGSTVPWPD